MNASDLRVRSANELNAQPCSIQDELKNHAPELLHDEFLDAIESQDLDMALSLLHHMAGQDLQFKRRTPHLDLSKISELLPEILLDRYSVDFDPERAMAWGHFVGRWMAHKDFPDSHYWMGNLIHNYISDLASLIRNDQIDEKAIGSHCLLIRTLCDDIDRVGRKHHLKPIAISLLQELHNGALQASLRITPLLTEIGNSAVLNEFANQLLESVENGYSSDWVVLASIVCLKPEQPIVIRAIAVAAEQRKMSADAFVFDSLIKYFDKSPNSILSRKMVEGVHQFMLNHKDKVKPLAQHIREERHLTLFRKQLNLDVNFFYSTEELPASARRFALEGDLGL